jgi:hypothetical protein
VVQRYARRTPPRRSFGGMKVAVNTVLNVLKWPLALCAVAGLPWLALATWQALIPAFSAHALPTWAAAAAGAVVGGFFWTRTAVGRFIATMEHELVHVVFAWLTFHRVQGLRAGADGNGVATFEGPGNWLIFLTPYFTPLLWFASCVGVAAAGLSPSTTQLLLAALLGGEMASSAREIHPAQTDFKAAHRLFSVLFLPAALLLVFGACWAYVAHGTPTAAVDHLHLLTTTAYDGISGWISELKIRMEG